MDAHYKIPEDILLLVEGLPYKQAVKAVAALEIIEREGLTPAVIEKWGRGKGQAKTLVISLGETKTRKEGEEHVTRVLKESLSIPIS
ncbi:hypothetical protein [Abiotrophia defectiva]|uniref:hypothetical protein n=1 Tax=Abiotrophia defectiva TaxID=46125 RepID=UPI0028D693AC|nr:hypothetical protein [Abiotrophia defectiva]